MARAPLSGHVGRWRGAGATRSQSRSWMWRHAHPCAARPEAGTAHSPRCPSALQAPSRSCPPLVFANRTRCRRLLYATRRRACAMTIGTRHRRWSRPRAAVSSGAAQALLQSFASLPEEPPMPPPARGQRSMLASSRLARSCATLGQRRQSLSARASPPPPSGMAPCGSRAKRCEPVAQCRLPCRPGRHRPPTTRPVPAGKDRARRRLRALQRPRWPWRSRPTLWHARWSPQSAQVRRTTLRWCASGACCGGGRSSSASTL